MKNEVPEEILKAGLDFVRVVNKVGAKCIGVVIVVVFDDTERVLPIVSKDVRTVSGKEPFHALIEQSIDALSSRLEMIPPRISDSERN